MSEPNIVDGGFADLGLESPSVEIPSYGVPQGTHHAFVKDAKFVAKNDDPSKKNLVLTYEVDEPGNTAAGKSIDEYKPANATDTAQVKGFLKERLISLGIAVEQIPSLNVKQLIGTPVFLTVAPQKDNPQYSRVVRVTLDQNGEFKVGAGIQAPVHNSPPAADASSLGY